MTLPKEIKMIPVENWVVVNDNVVVSSHRTGLAARKAARKIRGTAAVQAVSSLSDPQEHLELRMNLGDHVQIDGGAAYPA